MRAMIQTARLRIAYGELPSRVPEMSLRTLSQGSTCQLCRRPIEPHSIEVQFPDPRTTKLFVLHPACYSAWSAAVQKLAAPQDGEVDEGETRPPASP